MSSSLNSFFLQMSSSLNSFSRSSSSSSTHSIFTSPISSDNHRPTLVTCALRRHLRRRPHRHDHHNPEKPISTNPSSLQSDSNKFQLVIDLQHYLPKNTPLSFKRLLRTSQLKFNQFLHSGSDAVDDLRTLISYDNDRRVVVSCEKSTLHFVGNLALLGLIIVVSFRVILKLGLGFRELFRNQGGGGVGVIMRRDRSLGGKLVAVGTREDLNREFIRGSVNPLSSGEEVLEGVSYTLLQNEPRKVVPPKLPSWWPVSLTPPSVLVDKDEYQQRANRLVQAIMDNKLSGKDVTLEDIILLRRICRESGAKMSFDATNSRDSFYRASIDFVLKICSSMAIQSTVQIDGEDAREFITGLADNIGLEKIRAARMIAAAIAARTRSRLLQAWALEMQDNHSEAVVELLELCFIHRIFPPEEGSPEMEMVARGLANHLKLEQRQCLLELVTEVCFEESRRSLAEALGLVIPFTVESVEPQQENKLT